MKTIQLLMVSYFRPNDLFRCLDSILTNTREPYHLHLCDNSHGGLDAILDDIKDPHITVYRNSTNIGKGRAIMRWYDTIMITDRHKYFVSIDPDLLVPPDWLTQLEIAAMQLQQPLGMLAPAIVNDPNDSFNNQLTSGQLVMHRLGPDSKWVNGIFRNQHTAGCLFLIDKKFFKQVGGYAQTQLYGNDDGELCKAARRRNRFVGIVPQVKVLHLSNDNDDGYREWKKSNITGDETGHGYWD